MLSAWGRAGRASSHLFHRHPPREFRIFPPLLDYVALQVAVGRITVRGLPVSGADQGGLDVGLEQVQFRAGRSAGIARLCSDSVTSTPRASSGCSISDNQLRATRRQEGGQRGPLALRQRVVLGHEE